MPAAPDAPSDDSVERAAREQAGALLRAAREAAGRSVAELATQLKVSTAKIAALEAGDWSSLHDAAHARGLLRAAAKAVHADADAVLRPLPPPFVPGAPIMPPRGATLGPARAAEPVGTQAGNHRLVWMALLLVVLALALLYLPRQERLGHLLLQARALLGHHASTAQVSTVPRPGASDTAAAASSPAAAMATSASAASAAQPAASAAATKTVVVPLALPARAASPAASAARPAATVAASAAAPAAPMAAVASAPAGPALNLAASGRSWIEIRSRSGKVLYTGVLAAGASQDVATHAGDYPLRVVVGNAAQTRITMGGKPVDVHADSGNVARMTLRAAGN